MVEAQAEASRLGDENEERGLRLASAEAAVAQLQKALESSDSAAATLREEFSKTAADHAAATEAMKNDLGAARCA